MVDWYNKQLQRQKQQVKSRYSFSIEGDVFVEEQDNKEAEKQNVENKTIGKLSAEHGIRVNNYNIEPYKSF